MDESVGFAKLAEQAERYDDMVKYMKQVAESGTMKSEERNLFSVAYKNVVGTRRSAWRIVSSIEGKADTDPDICKEYRVTIEKELKEICEEVVVRKEGRNHYLCGKLSMSHKIKVQIFKVL